MTIEEVVEEGSKLMLSNKIYNLRLQRKITDKALQNLEEHTRKKQKVEPAATINRIVSPKHSRAQYYHLLKKNGIFDLSHTTKGYQVKKNLDLLKLKYSYKQEFDDDWLNEISKFTDLTKHMKPTNIANTYKDIKLMKANTDQMEAVKFVYTHVLKQHARAKHMLTDKYVDKCSEMSILVKFWAPLFESYFCYHDVLFLQWGDTVSLDCKAADLDLRLDLRVVLKSEQEDLEAMTGEAASRQATTAKKLYADRMKSVIVTKCHLNKLLTQMPFLSPREAKSLYMPIIQIMGLDCSVYAMNLVDKQCYAIQKVAQLKYPRTLRELRQGELKKLVLGLECINMMLSNLKSTLAEYSRDTRDKMDMAAGGRKKKATSTMKDWISGAIWADHDDNGNDDDDGDDDDDNEEDDNGDSDNNEEDDDDDEGNAVK